MPEIAAKNTEIIIALVGNPNSGKSSIFNALTGLRQKVANYPGVTVEKKTGVLFGPDAQRARIHDLPGLYSLVPKSLDSKITIDVLTGRAAEQDTPNLVVVVADSTNLPRSLYLATQVIDLGYPTLLALNMMDVAESNGIQIDIERLSKKLGIPIVPVIGNKRKGFDTLKEEIFRLVDYPQAHQPYKDGVLNHELKSAVTPIEKWFAHHSKLGERGRWAESVRVMSNDVALQNWCTCAGEHCDENSCELDTVVKQAREQLQEEEIQWQMFETKWRYDRIDVICKETIRESKKDELSFSQKLDRVLTHRLAGPAIFLFVFAVIFQSIFTWAAVPMHAIEISIGWFKLQVAAIMPDGVLEDLLVNGAITGVGAILVFLPQIMFLFFFISVLEDTGYMARVAFILDRFMRVAGLSGHSVIPLLSSFACAIPGIMATRTIQSWRNRLITIMIAPLMSCSARLPVYTLMIGAFIPSATILGMFSLAGLTLLSMYLLGIITAIVAALVMKRFVKKDQKTSTFVMELPPYRLPSLRWTALKMIERAKIFVMEAGKIILAISIVLWFLVSYPKPDADANVTPSQAIKQSYAGQVGHIIEPVIKPLGFDWKMGIALITSFAAREVLVSTLATIYNVEGAGKSSVSLREALKSEKDPETGKPVYTPLVAISLMVFFVLACQCMSTVAIVKRETNSWRWPIIMVVYMTVLAYLGSLFVYQSGKFLGLG